MLAQSYHRIRLHPDQWLPFLSARCRMDRVCIDGSRIVPTAGALPYVVVHCRAPPEETA